MDNDIITRLRVVHEANRGKGDQGAYNVWNEVALIVNDANVSARWMGAGVPLPDGHTIHESVEQPGRWAISDESGDYPELTDDGLLWLDNGGGDESDFRCLDGDLPSIPLVSDAGEETRTPTDTATILFLSRFLRWTINAGPNYYNVR